MKPTISIKFCCLLALAFCILCPIYVFAKDYTQDQKSKDAATDQQKQTGTNQQSSTTTKQDETLMKDLFKDATYENFAPQEKAEEQKPFDENYLEPRK